MCKTSGAPKPTPGLRRGLQEFYYLPPCFAPSSVPKQAWKDPYFLRAMQKKEKNRKGKSLGGEGGAAEDPSDQNGRHHSWLKPPAVCDERPPLIWFVSVVEVTGSGE